jgi:hypothetical protein
VPRVHQKPGTEVIEHAKAIGKDKTRVCKEMKKIKLEYAKKSTTARQDIGTNNGCFPNHNQLVARIGPASLTIVSCGDYL